MSEKLSLLEKIGKARIDFQTAKVKKTGFNKFVGYDYYELHDILPKINELSNFYRFICAVSFNSETAVLKIVDIDDQNQTIEFTSPMAGVNLKGAHEIQNMGAVQTYMRRYLYMMAFEIVECDFFDGSQGKKDEAKTPQNGTKNYVNYKNPAQNSVGSQEKERKTKACKMIGSILETLDPDGHPLFNEKEIEIEKALFVKNSINGVEKQWDRLTRELQKRKANWKPIPFSDERIEQLFFDDIPRDENLIDPDIY